MLYFCDGDDATWFRLENVGEANVESRAMDHAVEKYFTRFYDEAVRAYVPPASSKLIERNIGLKDHILRVMPRFLSLKDNEGTSLVTAMLPPAENEDAVRPIIVGHSNSDPYPEYGDSIELLGRFVGLQLDRPTCYPYSGR